MKKLLLALLLGPVASFAQTSVQKVGGGNNTVSNGPITIGANNTLTIASGATIVAASGSTVTGFGGAGGSPGGSNTQVQFNDSGNFGGDSKFTFNKTSGATVLTGALSGLTSVSSGTMALTSSSGGASLTLVGGAYSSTTTNGQNIFVSLGSGFTTYMNGFYMQNAANSDAFTIGQTGVSYAGSPLGSVGANQAYIYSPSKLIFARGTGATNAFTYDGTTLAQLGTTEASSGAGSITTAGGIYAAKKIITATGFEGATATLSGLTSGRVPFASTAGLLIDSSAMTFSAGTLSATTFSGAGTGLTGTASSLTAGSATTATTATNATNIGIADDTTTNATMYPTWVTTTTGNLPAKVSSTKMTFNPSTGALGATSFVGAGNFTTQSVSGIQTLNGTQVIPLQTASNTWDVTKLNNQQTISDSSTTLAFSGTPANSGQRFGGYVFNSSASAQTVTIPSSYSVGRVGLITTISVPPKVGSINGQAPLLWRYDGTVYNLYLDPPATTGDGSYVLSGNATITSATLVTPALGTPASGNLVNTGGLVPSSGVAATGTPSSSTFLRGDNTWSTPSGSGNITGPTMTNNAVILGNGTTSITPMASLGSSGQIFRSAGAGTPPIWSTPTFPNTATANKILVGDGTNIVLSTPTFPNASATANKIIISDGTNWIASTPTIPNAAGTAGNIVISDGTNYLSSNTASQTGTGNVVRDTAPQISTIELGAASDTTLSRGSAGVLAVEGVTVDTISATNTLTNKRVTARITSISSSATPTVNTDNCDCVTITALAAAITSMTSSLSGTPVNFDQLEYRILDNGTARAITWGASFASGVGTLPTTTILSKVLHVHFEWDSVQSKWICASTGSEP